MLSEENSRNKGVKLSVAWKVPVMFLFPALHFGNETKNENNGDHVHDAIEEFFKEPSLSYILIILTF